MGVVMSLRWHGGARGRHHARPHRDRGSRAAHHGQRSSKDFTPFSQETTLRIFRAAPRTRRNLFRNAALVPEKYLCAAILPTATAPAPGCSLDRRVRKNNHIQRNWGCVLVSFGSEVYRIRREEARQRHQACACGGHRSWNQISDVFPEKVFGGSVIDARAHERAKERFGSPLLLVNEFKGNQSTSR